MACSFAPFDGVPQMGGQVAIVLQVIWANGASMIILAGFQYLGAATCLMIGAAFILGHNLLDGVWPAGNLLAGTDPLWYGLHAQSSTSVGKINLLIAYPLLAWKGVMLLGYGTAYIFQKESMRRDAYLIKAGIFMILAFALIRAVGFTATPTPGKCKTMGQLPRCLIL
ncbi:MAG: putative membrane protein [Halieaceae bacterium]|jgi:uncharacterized membrane protein